MHLLISMNMQNAYDIRKHTLTPANHFGHIILKTVLDVTHQSTLRTKCSKKKPIKAHVNFNRRLCAQAAPPNLSITLL